MGAILADGGSATTLPPRKELRTSGRPSPSWEGPVEENVRLMDRGPALSSVPETSERSSASTASRSSGSRSSRVGPKGHPPSVYPTGHMRVPPYSIHPDP